MSPGSSGPREGRTHCVRQRLPSSGPMRSGPVASRGGKMLSMLCTKSSAGDSAAGAVGQGAWVVGQTSGLEDVHDDPVAEHAQLRMWEW